MSSGVKRKRSDAPLPSRKKLASTKKRNAIQRGSSVKGDQLNWKKVTISQHLDDAEGFFGLEELSDVEVVRDDAGPGVLFKPALQHGNSSASITKVSEGDVEEWSGFTDDESRPDTLKPVHDSDDYGDREQGIGRNQAKSQSRNTLDTGQSARGLDEQVRFDMLDSDISELETDVSAWKSLHLSSQMEHALSALKFSEPTPIQQAAIPPVLEGKDVVGKAVTGSGKTLAFGIPIIELWLSLHKSQSKKQTLNTPIALILAPTRELAHQISKHLTALCDGLDLPPRMVTITGGLSVQKQQRQLGYADIIVATPGRFWEVLRDSNELLEKCKQMKFLVVDEADRLLSEGHFQEVEEILDVLDRKVLDDETDDGAKNDQNESAIEHQRQTLVFSATFHKGLQQRLASRSKRTTNGDSNLLSDRQSMEYLMHKLPFQENQKPVFIDANPDSQLAQNLSETIIECKAMEKDLYLYTFLLQDQHRRATSSNDKTDPDSSARALVFTNSVSAVKRLVPFLQSLAIPSTSIFPLHSNMPQKARLRSLERFSGVSVSTKTSSTSVLIATDVAARGIDIQGITNIIHYHVPRTADTYVHRSGRTARVHESGNSILICSPDETASVTKLISKVHVDSISKSVKDASNLIDRMYLSNSLLRQVTPRVELAQKLIQSSQGTEKVRSEGNWLRKAAEDLGVEYDSDEFDNATKQSRRGRGGEKERRQKQVVKEEATQTKIAQWRAQLKEHLGQRLDFGEGIGRNMKYLAGGAFDVDKLLAERAETLKVRNR